MDRELGDLKAWPGPARRLPPGGSAWTWVILGGVGILLLIGLTLPKPSRDLRLMCYLSAAVLALVGSGFLLNDFAALGARSLHAPTAALRYFLLQIRAMRYEAARAVVAGHAAEVARHLSFKESWNGRQGPMRGLAVTGFAIAGVKTLVEDAALVRVSVHARPVAIAAILSLALGPLAYLVFAFMGKKTFDLTKLVVRRQGRWYVVHGMPEDAIDKALAEAIQRRAQTA